MCERVLTGCFIDVLLYRVKLERVVLRHPSPLVRRESKHSLLVRGRLEQSSPAMQRPQLMLYQQRDCSSAMVGPAVC